MGFLNDINPFDKKKTAQREAPPTEDTPFNHTAKENVQAAPRYLKRQATKLYEMCHEGPLSFRIMAFLGGLAMIGTSMYDFIMALFEDNFSLIIAIYAFLFGVGICILEGKHFSMPESWIKTMHFYFRILDFTWGRGIMYGFAGSLLMTQPGWANSGTGGYMLLVAFTAIISSIGAGQKLAQLRMAIDSQRDLKAFFKHYDRSGEGSLTQQEFAALMGGIGVDVTYQELVACFNAIDKNDDQGITYDEFLSWWNQFGEKRLHRGFSELLV